MSSSIDSEEDSPEFLTAGERYADSNNPYLEEYRGEGAKKPSEEATKRTGLYIAAPTIEAKLKNGPLFLQIFDRPGGTADLIPHIEEDEPSVDKPYE